MKIAVIEDDIAMAQKYGELIDKAFGDTDVQKYIMNDGLQGLFHVKCQRPEIIILDHRLPRISGLDIAREICYIYNPVIIFISGEVDIMSFNGHKDEKYISYMLGKPFHHNSLVETLRLCRIKLETIDMNRPRFIRQDVLLSNDDMLRAMIEDMLSDVNINLTSSSILFLSDALKSHLNPEVENVYLELADKYCIEYNSAFKRLQRIAKKVNPRYNNDLLLENVVSEVLKAC